MIPRNNRYFGCFHLAGAQRRVWRSSGFCQGFPARCQEKNELMQLSERCRGLAGLDVGIGHLGVPIGHVPASLGNVHLVLWNKKKAGSKEQTASSAAGNSSEWIFGEKEKKNQNTGCQRRHAAVTKEHQIKTVWSSRKLKYSADLYSWWIRQ